MILCDSCTHFRTFYKPKENKMGVRCIWLVPGCGIKTQCGHYIYEPGALG